MYYCILGNRHVNCRILFCVFFFPSVFIGLVDAAVDAAPGAGVFIQLHGNLWVINL